MPGGLICAFAPCSKSVTGADVARRIEVHRVDGELRAFGDGTSAGPLAAAALYPLAGVYHSKCWWALIKRERLLAARAADPSGQAAPSDWREQETAEVEALHGGFDAGHRGAGAAPG